MVDQNAVMAALQTVNDPELHRSIVSLNMIQNLAVEDGTRVLLVDDEEKIRRRLGPELSPHVTIEPVIVGEAGWPSEGHTRGNAAASGANEAYFVRAFVQRAIEIADNESI